MTIIILGFREGLAKAASEFDDVIVVADHLKPGLSKYPYVLVEDIGSTESVQIGLERTSLQDPAAVVTAHEQAVATCHELRRTYGLPSGADAATVIRFRDKKIQKDALSGSIPRAHCDDVDISTASYFDVAGRFGEKFVLKPADGFGSVATRIIVSAREYDCFVSEFGSKASLRFLAESFVNGTEWHVDGVWLDGTFAWSSVSTYTNSPIAWVQELAVGGAPLAGTSKSAEAEAVNFVGNALRELRAPNAIVHVEVFKRSDERFTFSEAAIRIAGGYVPEVLALTFGQNLYKAEVEIALGRRPQLITEPVDGSVFGYTYLLRTKKSTLTSEQLVKKHDLVHCEYPPVGEGHTGAYGRWGYAIARGSNYQDVISRLRHIAQTAEGAED